MHHWLWGMDAPGLTYLWCLLAGWYGVPDGLVFSFPVLFTQPGSYKVVSDLELTEELISKMEDFIEVKLC